MNLINRLSRIWEMGHPRSRMTLYVDSIQDSVQEHIWKLSAYDKDRKDSINAWIRTLNKFLLKLQLYNVQKNNSNRKNVDRKYLLDKFVTEIFEYGDLFVLNANWSSEEEPFPNKEITKELLGKCQSTAKKYIECILSNTKFYVEG